MYKLEKIIINNIENRNNLGEQSHCIFTLKNCSRSVHLPLQHGGFKFSEA